MRREKDALGYVEVPDDSYYGAQTERARLNFLISGETTDQYPSYIRAIALIKKAAAMTNLDLGALAPDLADAIIEAANEIIDGKLTGQYPLNILQGGGGTSSNMNLNEVIANRANEILTGHKGSERVHPNNHVNMGQSTNDVIPSAVKLSAWKVLDELYKQSKSTADLLLQKSSEFEEVVKLGRTCLQDAIPITMGQEFSGYATLISRCSEKVADVQAKCLSVPMGATAIGTGSGAHAGYKEKIAENLSRATGLPITIDENLFDGLQNGDIYIDIMHAIKSLAVSISKIATDFRLLSSGPRAGLNEIVLPAVQPGSSIMPGKINPVMPELMNQVCYDICGNDVSITMAVEGGELDLFVWEPLAVKKIVSSAQMLTNALQLFSEKCIAGIQANREICRDYAERSLANSNLISAIFDYYKGTEVSQRAYKENKTIRQVTVEMGMLTKTEADELFDPMVLTNESKMALLVSKYRGQRKE